MAAADTHRHADHAELRIPEAERHGTERPLGTALDVAVAAHEMLAVVGDGDIRAAGAVDLRLKDVPAHVAQGARIEQTFYASLVVALPMRGILAAYDERSRRPGRQGSPNAGRWRCVSRGVVDYGPDSSLVHRLVSRIAELSVDDAADLYEAYAARILIYGSDAERRALGRAHHAAVRRGLEPEYVQARHDAATAWRQAVPDGRGPWLLVGRAIANVAGALVIQTALDDKAAQMLIGPWRMAIGSLEPVGPGISTYAHAGGR